jgi:hypothetical protein
MAMDALIESGLYWVPLVTIPLLAYVIYRLAGGGRHPVTPPGRPAVSADAHPSYPQTVELVNRRYNIERRHHRTTMVIVVVGVLAVLVLAQVIISTGPEELGWGALYDHLRKRYAEKPFDALSFLLTSIAMVVALLVHVLGRQQRIVLSQSGVRYVPGAGIMRRIRPGWAVQWGELRGATLSLSRARPTAELARLTLITERGQYKVLPHEWIFPDQWERPSIFRQLRLSVPDFEDVLARLRASPLLRFLADAGVQVRVDTNRHAHGFDLGGNRYTVAAIGLMCALGAYALIDHLLFNEAYAEAPLHGLNLALGAAAALIAASWLRRGAVPALESVALALLVGGAVFLAAYPGLLRVNQLTDDQGLKSYEYVLQNDMTLRAATPGIPPLRLGDRQYWQSFAAGSVHNFDLRRGGLGFYQVDLGPYHDRLRGFYNGARRP